jgi:hypothetical protein
MSDNSWLKTIVLEPYLNVLGIRIAFEKGKPSSRMWPECSQTEAQTKPLPPCWPAMKKHDYPSSAGWSPIQTGSAPNICHERIGGSEHDAGIVHSLTGELLGRIAGRARSIQHGLHGKAFERSIDCRKDKTNCGY